MREQMVLVKNVARLNEAMKKLNTRAPGAPGIGIADGLPGIGKSHTTMWLMARENGVFIRALAAISPSSLLEFICIELDIEPRSSNAKTIMAIVEKLRQERRPVFIDEADKLVLRKQLIEIVRDIADLSGVPVILIGEGHLQRKIEAIPRLASRIMEVVDFKPLDNADARLVAKQLCEIDIADDLLEDINREARGTTRLLIVAFHKAENIARAEGKAKLALKDWPKGEAYFVGHNLSDRRSR